MTSKPLKPFAALVLAAGLLSIGARAIGDPASVSAAPVPSPAPRQATAAPSPMVTGSTTADAGLVDEADSTDATHIFQLTNNTSGDLPITGVRGTCGCEHLALVGADGKPVDKLIVAPGAVFDVQMKVRLEGQPGGTITKEAFVLGGQSGSQILASLHLTFRVRKPYTFNPAMLDFGDVAAGTAEDSSVVVIVDRDSAPGGVAPTLKSDNPYITVGPPGPLSNVDHDGKPGLSAAYPVHLNAISVIGRYHADLHMAILEAGGVSEDVAFPMTANVIGTIDVAPKAVYFGVVQKGSSVTRTMLVTAKTADDLQALMVKSDSTSITASIKLGAPGATNCLISVSISPQAPTGPLSTFLTVQSGKGEMTRIPVAADIIAGQ